MLVQVERSILFSVTEISAEYRKVDKKEENKINF